MQYPFSFSFFGRTGNTLSSDYNNKNQIEHGDITKKFKSISRLQFILFLLLTHLINEQNLLKSTRVFTHPDLTILDLCDQMEFYSNWRLFSYSKIDKYTVNEAFT